MVLSTGTKETDGEEKKSANVEEKEEKEGAQFECNILGETLHALRQQKIP